MDIDKKRTILSNTDIRFFFFKFDILKEFLPENVERITLDELTSHLKENGNFIESESLKNELENFFSKDFFKKVDKISNTFKTSDINALKAMFQVYNGSLKEDKVLKLKKEEPGIFEKIELPKLNIENLFVKINNKKIKLVKIRGE